MTLLVDQEPNYLDPVTNLPIGDNLPSKVDEKISNSTSSTPTSSTSNIAL